MIWRRHRQRLLLAACVISAPAHADVSFHGFGQVVVGSTLGNSHDVAVPTNLQYESDPRFDQESLLALQVDAPLSDRISATAQILSRADNDYTPKFELAYAKAEVGDNWFQVMAGRQRLPLYLHSTYLAVGESYIWMRPPLTVYFEPVEDFDGISLYNEYYLGKDWSLKPQVIYGAFDVQFSFSRSEGQTQQADFSASNLGGGAIELNYKTVLRLRAEYFMTTTTTTTDQIAELLDGFRAVGLNEAADLLDDTDKLAYFRGGGIEYKPGKWMFSAEYVQSAVDHSYVPKSEQYYLTAGRRFGKFEAAVTYQHNEEAASGESLAAIPPQAACYVPTGQLVPGLCLLEAQTLVSQTRSHDRYYELSLRYDLTARVALKADYTAYNSAIGQAPSANLLSAGITFEF